MKIFKILFVIVVWISSSINAMTEPPRSIQAEEVTHLMHDPTSFLSWPPTDIKTIIWSLIKYPEWVQEKKYWKEKKYSGFQDFVHCDFPAARNPLIRKRCIHKLKKGAAEIFYHVATNNEGRVHELINKDRSQVKNKLSTYKTVLHIASIFGHHNLVSFIIKIDPSLIHQRDETGWTPFYYAVRLGWVKVVEVLLDKGADKNHIKDRYDSPLTLAARHDHADVVRLLLNCRAYFDSYDKKGETPLYVACQNGFLSCVDILLTAGAKTSIKDEKGRTPFFVAVENNHIEVVRRLCGVGVSVNCKNGKNVSALEVAASKGYEDMCRFLLEYGAKPMYGNGLVLHHASEKFDGIISILPLLLEKKKIKITKKDADGCHPLHIAAKANNVNAIHLFMQNGAQLNAQNNDKRTPLHMAVIWHKLEAVTALLEYKPSLEIQDKHGDTPLFAAVRYNNCTRIMKLLLSAGASIEAKGCGAPYIPLKIEDKKWHSAKEHANRTCTCYDRYNCFICGKSVCCTVVRYHANPEVICRECLPYYQNKATPLFLACRKEREGQITLLVESGADVSQAYAAIGHRDLDDSRSQLVKKVLDKVGKNTL